MKFRKGNLVEILGGEIDSDGGGSWFPGQVISVLDDAHLLARYESLFDDHGDPLTETVLRNEVRPKPPVRKVDNWKVGDATEVFDAECWRAGRIVKAFKKNNNFVVKLSGSVQPKEFHESNLRIHLVWHKNKWFVMGKDAQTRTKGNGVLASRPTSLKMMNNHPERASRDLVFSHKRPLHQKNADAEEASHEWFDDASSFVPRPLQIEDSSYWQCSVASCSSNEFPESHVHDLRQSANVVSENSDAESSFPSLRAKKQRHVSTRSSGQKLEQVDIHALEFHAYRSTVKALYVAGPLSWEQELLLTNLRESLHISDEEHLLQLRRLLSTEVL
ncbi:DUF724 domain-containing protein 3 [Linum grandiflorum]